tara:strand:- start:11109 stop:11303 length:195 start_codon:yes stop_codon:yes gene_type:complete
MDYKIIQNDKTEESFYWYKNEWLPIEGDFATIKVLTDFMRKPSQRAHALKLLKMIDEFVEKNYH